MIKLYEKILKKFEEYEEIDYKKHKKKFEKLKIFEKNKVDVR